MANFFRRVEKKYIITKKQYLLLKEAIKDKMVEDEYGKSKICNIYFDTNQYDLISHSITKPIFKDKVRLRSYNLPQKNSTVYLEIKRKYDGVVSKRRTEIILEDFYQCHSIQNTKKEKSQIEKELDYYYKFYNLEPAMFLSYDRVAYYDKDNKDFRLTIDKNIVARNYDLYIEKGNYGTKILNKDTLIMEVKTLGATPIWFVKLLENFKIYPSSFSKYGEAYKMLILNEKFNKSKVI